MASISRRMFLKQSGSGVAAAGVLAALPALPGRVSATRKPATVHTLRRRGARRARGDGTARRAHPRPALR